MKQSELAAALGLSRATVSRAVAAGMPLEPEAAAAWRAQRVRPRVASEPAAAAPRTRSARLDVAHERAALLRQQRTEVALRNAKTRGELAPIGYLAEVLAAAGAELVQKLDALPALLRRAHPELDAAALDAVRATLTAMRNETADAIAAAVRRTAADATYDFSTDDDGDDDDADKPTD